MKIVYLDQNKWIDLAREAAGLDSAHRFAEALQAARSVVDRDAAVFPLCLGHYIEPTSMAIPTGAARQPPVIAVPARRSETRIGPPGRTDHKLAFGV